MFFDFCILFFIFYIYNITLLNFLFGINMDKFVQFFLNHIILAIIWLTLFSVLVFIIFRVYFSKIKEIVCIDVIYLINKKSAVVVDLRDRNEYYKGHIINSVNLVSEDIKLKKFGNLCKMKDKHIIVVCNHGFFSRNSAEYLLLNGFKNVYVLKGGIFEWKESRLPLVYYND
ncbi:MAG: putative sulfurtransferase YibN [Candidatus Westeberhardia cardiocondylae]|nr:putative sulfurtransferase YibN [Candidatus Westeberhardia cardiocondylae]